MGRIIILIILLYSYFYIYKKVTSFTVPHVYDTVNVYPKKNMNYSGQYVLNKNNFISGEDDYFTYYCVVLYVKYIAVAEFMWSICTVKKVNDFRSPDGMSLTKLSLAGNN